MFFTKKAARVKELESRLDEEIKHLRGRLSDPALSDCEKKRIHEQLQKLEESMRAETSTVRKKCGLHNHEKK